MTKKTNITSYDIITENAQDFMQLLLSHSEGAISGYQASGNTQIVSFVDKHDCNMTDFAMEIIERVYDIEPIGVIMHTVEDDITFALIIFQNDIDLV